MVAMNASDRRTPWDAMGSPVGIGLVAMGSHGRLQL